MFTIDSIIPYIAIVVSICFGSYGYISSKKTKSLLDQIEKATSTWQNDINRATVDMLNSSPSVVGSKAYLTKIEAANKLSETIQSVSNEILKNKTDDKIYGHLKMLLDHQYFFLNSILDPSQAMSIIQKSVKKADQSK